MGILFHFQKQKNSFEKFVDFAEIVTIFMNKTGEYWKISINIVLE